jgi:hypothetical protein
MRSGSRLVTVAELPGLRALTQEGTGYCVGTGRGGGGGGGHGEIRREDLDREEVPR